MYTRLSTVKRLAFSERALAIAQSDPVLKEAFAEEGFSEDRFLIGQTKQQRASALQIDQQVEYSTRLEVTGELDALFEKVRAAFIADRGIAKIALKRSPGLFERLKMIGIAEQSRDLFLQQARHFYQEILADTKVVGVLSPYSLTQDVLESRQQDVVALVSIIQAQQLQSAEALLATRRRREAMADLDDWMIKFLFVAKRVFKNSPRQLEKLGIPVK